MKNKLIKILSLCLVLTLVFSFTACKDKNDSAKDTSAQSAGQKADVLPNSAAVDDGQVASPEKEAATEQAQQPRATNEEAKYSNVEIYEKDGAKYANTEDGDEVELSGENLQELMTEYAAVQGSGSAEEKDLLDKIQVILDNADRLQ